MRDYYSSVGISEDRGNIFFYLPMIGGARCGREEVRQVMITIVRPNYRLTTNSKSGVDGICLGSIQNPQT